MKITITPRKSALAEAACLHEELKSTPNILGYTIPELLRFSHVLIAEAVEENGVAFAGICISKDLLFNWTDIALLYVLPDFRGQGISTRLFDAAFVRAQERRRHIYALSRSPQVIHLMEKSGMTLTRAVWKAPLAVHIHMNCHMNNWYRLRESVRKSKMRKDDGNHFVVGTKRR